MKKGKIVSMPTSTEGQIRSRARNLPIDKCYLNEDWKESQMVTIIVTRKHSNGNYTVGSYLVDLLLLGVKDCSYEFNEPVARLEGMLDIAPLIECDYALAHNIIYGGIEFAGDFGFEPDKSFKIAQYILEEDTDDIPLMDIPLGFDGVPAILVPYGETCLREISVLEQTANGNYEVIYLDEDGDPIDDEDNEGEDEPYLALVEELTGMGDIKDPEAYTTTPKRYQVLTDLSYFSIFYDSNEMSEISRFSNELINDPRVCDDDQEIAEYPELNEFAILINDDDLDGALIEMERIVKDQPDNPYFWDLYLDILNLLNEDLEDAAKEAYGRFPLNISIKLWYAAWLARGEKWDDILVLFDHTATLDALTTENIPIQRDNVLRFSALCAMIWLHKDNIKNAESYYQIVACSDFNQGIAQEMINLMVDKRTEKLIEYTS